MTQVPEPGAEPIARDQAPVPPPAVAALADERQLGQLCTARIVANPLSIAKLAVISGVPSAILAAIGLPSENTFLVILGILGLFGILITLVIIAYATKTAVAGGDDWYLYANGFVDGRRRRLRAVTWDEVSTVTRARMGLRARRRGSLMTPETLRGYKVSLRDGTSLFLTASDVLDEGKLLGAQLEHLATQARVPVSG